MPVSYIHSGDGSILKVGAQIPSRMSLCYLAAQHCLPAVSSRTSYTTDRIRDAALEQAKFGSHGRVVILSNVQLALRV